MNGLAVTGAAAVLLSACRLPNDSETSVESKTLVESAMLSSQEPFRALAQHWAPRFYQDTHKAFYKGDYITRFNYDGDYVGKNNWESLDAYQSVPAYVYYAVSKTATHYFINYSLFHPRDWDSKGIPGNQHENDFEGLSLMIKKDGGFGTLVAMETLAHHQFNQYAPEAGITSGSESLDGQVSLHGGSHPRIFVEAAGHGVFNCDARCDAAPGGDGIVYYEADVAAEPTGGDGNWTRAYSYKLISMDADGSFDGNEGLWTRRDDICD
ncbi:MAG TPA: hypothetical protein VK465_05265, partial [Fibrobacteria bacterium]|nr:hypothetical protein [Fibrobacteria bacterium]